MIRDIPLRFMLTAGFLLSGLLPLMVVGLVSYSASRGALRDQAFRQLEAVRSIKKAQLERFFDERLGAAVTLSKDPYLLQAYRELCAAMEAEGGVQGGRFVGRDHERFDAPASYRAVHDRHAPWLKLYIQKQGFYDLLLLDPIHGDTCFTVLKERDFGSRTSAVPSALRDVWLSASREGRVTLSDTRPYAPSDNAAAQFVAAPLQDARGTIGVLALQISVEAIDQIMGDASGMGQTGETYLVGPDFKMRSDAILDRVKHSLLASFRGSVSENGAFTEAVKRALAGRTGADTLPDYRGQAALSAYAPLQLPGLTWAIIAKIDEEEMDRQIGEALNHTLLLLLLGSSALVLILAAGVSRLIQGSIRTIIGHLGHLTKEVVAGKLEARGNPDLVAVDFRGVVVQINDLARTFVAHLDALPIPILMVDPSHRLRFVNQAGARLVGLPRDQLVGQPCAKAMGADHCRADNCPLSQAWERGTTVMAEGRVSHPGGTREVFCSASPIVGPEGELLGGLEVLIDQTEIKRISQEKEALEAQVQRMQRLEAIGTLAGGIAHDFNNVLTYMYAYVELATELIPEDSPARPQLDHVTTAIHRATELVQQILTFSRQNTVEKQVLDMTPIVKETVKLVRASLPKRITVVTDFRTGSCPILADPTQVHQVLINLLTNAFHAMQDQGGTLSVSLETVTLGKGEKRPPKLADGVYCRLEVRDTGCGMDARTQEKIFEPFFTTKPVGQGTGMGLAFVHGMVTGAGGAIQVESQLGQGSSFTLYLPRASSGAKAAGMGDPAPSERGTGRILFVDDEVEICNVGRALLEALGFEVVTECRPARALEVLEEAPQAYNLLITDLSMPGMGGVELMQRARRSRPDLPVLLTTGYDERMNAERARELGAAGLLLKPYSRSRLSQAVKAALQPPPEA